MIDNLLENTGFNKLKKGKYGYYLYNKNDIYIGKSIDLYGECCELEILFLNQICKKGDIIVEIGGNIGTHTVALARAIGNSGKIYVYEPQRLIFQTLCANIALNSLSNVYAYNYGLGEKKDKLYLKDIAYEKQNNFGGVTLESDITQNEVKIYKLDDIFKEDKLKLIKIDVEGMELDVLKGAFQTIQKFQPILYIENDRQDKSKELIEYIFNLGYDIYWHLPHLYNPNNFYNIKQNLIGNYISVNMLCIHKTSDIKVENLSKVTDSSYHPLQRG